MSPQQQRDLRAAAVHEYGHAVVARRLGVLGHVRLYRNPNGGRHERHVTGTFFPYFGLRGGETPPQTRRLIGLAGCVAELVDRSPRDIAEDALLCDILDTIDAAGSEGSFSATDAEMVGDFTIQDVLDCLALVREAWPEIDQEARWAYLPEVGDDPEGERAYFGRHRRPPVKSASTSTSCVATGLPATDATTGV